MNRSMSRAMNRAMSPAGWFMSMRQYTFHRRMNAIRFRTWIITPHQTMGCVMPRRATRTMGRAMIALTVTRATTIAHAIERNIANRN